MIFLSRLSPSPGSWRIICNFISCVRRISHNPIWVFTRYFFLLFTSYINIMDIPPAKASKVLWKNPSTKRGNYFIDVYSWRIFNVTDWHSPRLCISVLPKFHFDSKRSQTEQEPIISRLTMVESRALCPKSRWVQVSVCLRIFLLEFPSNNCLSKLSSKHRND